MPGSGLVVGDDGLARPLWASVDPLLREYYDIEWGMPVRDERGMFERLSLEAAKEWTFAPLDTQEQRIMLVRFSYTRERATARANPPQ